MSDIVLNLRQKNGQQPEFHLVYLLLGYPLTFHCFVVFTAAEHVKGMEEKKVQFSNINDYFKQMEDLHVTGRKVLKIFFLIKEHELNL